MPLEIKDTGGTSGAGSGGQFVQEVLSKHGFTRPGFTLPFELAEMTTRLAESLCLTGVHAPTAMRSRFRRYGSAVLAKRAKKLDKAAQANKEEAKITANRILAKLREQEAGLTKPKPPHQKQLEYLWSRLDKVVTGWGKDSR